MTFITLDNKNWCKGVYQDGELHVEHLPENMNKTWKYASYLESKDIEYAYLYASGKSLDQICPEHIKDEWKLKKQKLKAFHNSFIESKISLDDNCFFDLVPKQFLLELCETKVQIIDYCFSKIQKPKNYDLLLDTQKLLDDISNKKLNLNLEILKNNLHDNRARILLDKVKNSKTISYNLFGSKTGRLTTNPNTFPILNLDAKYRSLLQPNNDAFVELDFNSAEARVLIGLSGQDQPDEDIHLWNAKRLGVTREEAKKDIFAWMYGSQKVDKEKYEKMFNLNKILENSYDGKSVTNIYGRKIESDDFHKINYLIQSTTNDLVLEQVSKINKMLKNKKTYISFLVHDAVVIDLAKEDKELINPIIGEMRKTRIGNFPVNVSIGKDYGSLRRIQC